MEVFQHLRGWRDSKKIRFSFGLRLRSHDVVDETERLLTAVTFSSLVLSHFKGLIRSFTPALCV